MTADPRLDAFREHTYAAEQKTFANISSLLANQAFQLNPNKARTFESIIANNRLSINYAKYEFNYLVEELKKKAFEKLEPQKDAATYEDFILDRVSALDPFNKRLFEVLEQMRELDFELRTVPELQGISMLNLIKIFLNGSEEDALKEIKLLATRPGEKAPAINLKPSDYESAIQRVISSSQFTQLLSLYVEYLALEKLNKFVIENTLLSLTSSSGEQTPIEYIDFVFDFLTNPQNSSFVLPETVDLVLDLFAEHVKSARYKFNSENTTAPGYIAYATLRGNEQRLRVFEQRFGDLGYALSDKLKAIETLIIGTPEQARAERQTRRIENLKNMISGVSEIFTLVGISNVDEVFTNIIYKSKLSKFQNQNLGSFSSIDNTQDLITAVYYLLQYLEGITAGQFHAFARHRSSITMPEIDKLFMKDSTRTAHGVFLDDMTMAKAMISGYKELLTMLKTPLNDYAKEFMDGVNIEFKDDIGDIYRLVGRNIVKDSTTKKVRIAIAHTPGKTSRQTLVSIYPLV